MRGIPKKRHHPPQQSPRTNTGEGRTRGSAPTITVYVPQNAIVHSERHHHSRKNGTIITILVAAVLLCVAIAPAAAQEIAPADTFDVSAAEAAINSRIKFGRRVAFNHTHVTNLRVRIYSHDGESFRVEEYRNIPDFGFGFELAAIIRLTFDHALSLNFTPAVVLRKPLNTAVVGISEIAVALPVLLEWQPFDQTIPQIHAKFPLRVYGGFQAGVPVYTRVTWNNEGGAPFSARTPVDFGVAVGGGVDVNDRAFVDARVIFGVSGYDGVGGRKLNQVCVGVNYVR